MRGFICRTCNSVAGESWDAELARQLNGLSLLFAVTRERGEPARQIFGRTGGGEVSLGPGGMTIAKPIIMTSESEKGLEYKISARSIAEARGIVEGLKKKHPNIDVESVMKSAAPVREYMNDMIKMAPSVGGRDAGRSMIKSILAMAHSCGADVSSFTKPISYIRSGDNPQFGYYYDKDVVKNRPTEIIFHCACVQSTPNGVIGYLELFSAYRILTKLSSDTGVTVSGVYAIDPVTGIEIDLDIDLNIPDYIIDISCRNDGEQLAGLEAAFHSILPIALTASEQRERSSVVERAVKIAFERCGAKQGEVLTQEHIAAISQIIAEEVLPYVLSRLRSARTS